MERVDRRAEIELGLRAVTARVARACAAADRDPAGVTLVVVTKNRPPSDVRLLAGLGVSDVGENRDQEAAPKAAACADLPLRWHFVGQLQSNKVRSVVRYAALVHSVDRPRLVRALDDAAQRAGRLLDALVQVRLGSPQGQLGVRGGADPRDVPALADAVAAAPWLRLAGLMAVAPPEEDPRTAFTRLAGLAAAVRAGHPEATALSAGMSGDLEAAVACGATHVRVGTAILGPRPSPG